LCVKLMTVVILPRISLVCGLILGRYCLTSTPDSMDSVEILTEKFIETLPTRLHRTNKDPAFFADVCSAQFLMFYMHI